MRFVIGEDDFVVVRPGDRKPPSRAAKKAVASRAFCPGASPPDNSCSPANKGEGEAKSDAFGSARREHAKQLSSLRRRLALSDGRAARRIEEARKSEQAARAAQDDLMSRDRDLRLEYTRLQESYEKTGDPETLAAKNKVATELNTLDAAIDKAYRQEGAATGQRIVAERQAVEEMHDILRKECQNVDREDARTLRERRDAAKAVEEAHAVEQIVDAYTESNKDNFSINKASPELARLPYTAGEREAGLKTLREIVNHSIHAESLAAPIEYVDGVRANASGFVEIVDFTDYSDPVLPAETMDALGMTGIREQAYVGRVQLSPTDGRNVIAHEYGHQIEHGNAEAARLCADFLDRRTANETPVLLGDKFPNNGYGSDERGSPDEFEKAISYVRKSDGDGSDATAGYWEALDRLTWEKEAHYVGKRYPSQGRTSVVEHAGKGTIRRTSIGATEVLSIGMELMAQNPARFAKADPEWFDLVAGITTGRLLTKTREKRAGGAGKIMRRPQ
jgi:hypothetical protein